MSPGLWRNIGFVLVTMIVVASLVPMPDLPGPDVPLQDKWLHLVAWGGLAGWFGQILNSTGARVRCFVVLFSLSSLIEVAQIILPFRDGDWGDLVANALGLSIGSLISAAVTLPSVVLSQDA